jgi:micrococcal nuclease
MKWIIILLTFPFLVFANCEHDSKAFRCVKYLYNYDADTITFNVKNVHPLLGKKMKVRVSGVDTPEIRTKDKCEKQKGRTAKRFVENLLKHAKKIDLENIQRGKYFRVVADVIIDGKNLSKLLIKNNLAYVYHGGKKKKINWCADRKVATE